MRKTAIREKRDTAQRDVNILSVLREQLTQISGRGEHELGDAIQKDLLPSVTREMATWREEISVIKSMLRSLNKEQCPTEDIPYKNKTPNNDIDEQEK